MPSGRTQSRIPSHARPAKSQSFTLQQKGNKPPALNPNGVYELVLTEVYATLQPESSNIKLNYYATMPCLNS